MSKNKLSDLKDSKRDEEKLKQDEATLDLPEVKDIPGQENITVPDFKEMADTTISSDDEEGTDILAEDDADATSERIGAAQEIDEDDLIINEDEAEAEAELDEEDKADKSEDELNITDDSVDPESDVSEDEKIALERSSIDVDTPDNEALYESKFDNTDFDGEKLNEDTDDVSGKDLDVPGAEDDDENEEIGEEDEENNEYSLGDTE
ncbi:MAG TPA: hypothetical protein VEV62_01660 [Parafilimonas sp.]|nr:hypothetical protein [Parafilimonas sp.]